MKDTILLGIIALFAIGIASCSHEKSYTDMSEVPVAVQTTVTDNFQSGVASAKVETNAIGVDEYEVYLQDGTKVKFEGEDWEEVKVPAGQSVPDAFVIEPIRTYVANTQEPGITIVKIEKDKNGYDIELSNGVDIEFDQNGNFVKMD